MKTGNFTRPQREIESPVRSVLSFTDVLQRVRDRVEAECFAEYDKQLVNEICRIITEVEKLNPNNEMWIDGVMLSTGMVQEVYSQITHAHVELVIQNFKSITYEIRKKKAYFRTTLYNSVFELESHWTNQVNKDWHNTEV